MRARSIARNVDARGSRSSDRTAAVRFDIDPQVALAISELTRLRYVALFAIGFEVILIDDGRRRCSLEVPDLATRMDVALACLCTRRRATRHWIVLDQASGESFILPAQDAHRLLSAQ